jgi:predicted phosphoribosyltransferase
MFKDRKDAGQRLSQLLLPYRSEDVIVLAIPRGGIVLAHEIAKALNAPLDLLFAHKIGHPLQEEFAIAAISEEGYLVGNPEEYASPEWLENAKQKALLEIKRRRNFYLKGRKKPNLVNKVVILVDDGIATGLTLKAALLEVKQAKPKKLIVATAVAPKSTADSIKNEVDAFVALTIDPDSQFLGAVGAYFENFPPVEDQEVMNLL